MGAMTKKVVRAFRWSDSRPRSTGPSMMAACPAECLQPSSCARAFPLTTSAIMVATMDWQSA